MFELASVLSDQLSIQTGRIVSFESDGMILVAPAAPEPPVRSHFVQTSQAAPPPFEVGDAVLFAVDADGPRGYVFGVIAPYAPPLEAERGTAKHEPTEEVEIHKAARGAVEIALPRTAETMRVTGKKIHIDAGEEVRLTCGGGTILIDKRGKIVVRGNEILSRARRTNKIKGASVAIN